ncbi:acetyltransferase [Empedobacter brevis]|uniref:acetyltransferase n=1 Tax=Empedobacter brevis TaxID=247 RepID=UPI00289DCE7F|nr:acetyltransferase [Empedobacter brevis]
MLIVGAKGFAKEVLEICHQNNELENLVFYDDVNEDIGDKLYNKFPILKTLNEAENYFKVIDNRFTIGIGNPGLRKMLVDKFEAIGGINTTTIANNCSIGNYGNKIGSGCNIMQKVIITNDILIGKSVIINQLSSVGHDVTIEDYVEICPSVSISGNCFIGANSFIGTNSTILPKVKLGKNVVIGAGSVVTRDIPDNCTAVGIPAKIIKQE